MKMLSLPASPASIQRLHARLVPGGTPPLAMSPIYLLMTIKSMVRRPLHFDWPEDQSTIAWLRVSFEENDGEGSAGRRLLSTMEEGFQNNVPIPTCCWAKTTRNCPHFAGSGHRGFATQAWPNHDLAGRSHSPARTEN